MKTSEPWIGCRDFVGMDLTKRIAEFLKHRKHRAQDIPDTYFQELQEILFN